VDDRIRFIEHKGKQILLLDFSHATAPQMLSLLMHVRTTVAQHEPKSVLILADYEGAEIDHKAAFFANGRSSASTSLIFIATL
jgi:hypothetical protein